MKTICYKSALQITRRLSVVCLVGFAIGNLIACGESWDLSSPHDRLQVQVSCDGKISYSLSLHNQPVIANSTIDLKLAGSGWQSEGATNVVSSQRGESEIIEFPVPRKYREKTMDFTELTLQMNSHCRLVFRAYEEGVAFRWELSEAQAVTIEDELVEFLFPGSPKIWFPEEESMFSHQERSYPYISLDTISEARFCSTGTLLDLGAGRKVYISESDVRSYPGMFLRGKGVGTAGLVGKFAPYPIKVAATSDRDVEVQKTAPYLAKVKGKRSLPWRVILVTEHDAELLKSELVYALSPPNALEDTSWIKPGKVAWDWWNNLNLRGVDFSAGINTDTYKYFIDFAAENNLQYILLDEGWTASTVDILHENPNVNLSEIMDHAREQNIGVILWVLSRALDENLEEALDRFAGLGVAGIKVDFMQRDDQIMMEFYERVAKECAKRHLLVDYHGACKPTGLNRIYPNIITSEGLKGLEQYKWSAVSSNPEHELILPFIRMVPGPMDFTPGAMNNATFECFHAINNCPMSLGTRCHQLAMYVIYESPLQMLADSPTAYREEPECMKFLSAVPTIWDDTRILAARVSDYVAIARRSGDEWFIGAMTDRDRRELKLDLDFLPAGEYNLQVWKDGCNADRDARDFALENQRVNSQDEIEVKLAPGGGWVGILRPSSTTDREP